jgi:hypothetical protein
VGAPFALVDGGSEVVVGGSDSVDDGGCVDVPGDVVAVGVVDAVGVAELPTGTAPGLLAVTGFSLATRVPTVSGERPSPGPGPGWLVSLPGFAPPWA